VLLEARSRIRRYTPEEAKADPELLLIPGSQHFPLSVVPWRTDELAGRRVCLVCAQGYSSSLAAALLVELGVDAGDLIGGYEAW
jgi:rhodanese-related sulfurtransferase